MYYTDYTLIQNLGDYENNHLYIKREDLIPFSFGGNKARKAELFFREIDQGDYDCVVTYGSGSSNHCRVVANMCCQRKMKCYIIGPEEASKRTFNSKMMQLFGADITIVSVNAVHDTIEQKLKWLRHEGKKPYFIEGGGHGNIGTEAYVQCYREIKEFEKERNVFFDYFFLASGTGTTQAGLVCGQLLHEDKRKIIGISIARKNPRGRDVVLGSEKKYLRERFDKICAEKATIFVDDYTESYGKANQKIIKTINAILMHYGIPLDATYTGKAFTGMTEYIREGNIKEKNILFIHTGGTPLFFDGLQELTVI